NDAPELRDLLETSAIYALPSDYENFSIGLLEAMASGAAVVTTRGTGCEEVVGDTGVLVPRAIDGVDACVEALREAFIGLGADPALGGRLGRAGRARVEAHFSWDQVADRYLARFERCLGDREAAVAPEAGGGEGSPS